MNALHGIGEGNLKGIATLAKAEALLMVEIELAEDALGHGAGGHDHVGGVGVELGVDAAGIDLIGALANVDDELVDVGVGDHHGAFGVDLELELGNFEGDGFGAGVGGVGGEEDGD